jgi:hypothetical protein
MDRRNVDRISDSGSQARKLRFTQGLTLVAPQIESQHTRIQDAPNADQRGQLAELQVRNPANARPLRV